MVLPIHPASKEHDMGNTATAKQLAFIESLKTQRDITSVEAHQALDLSRQLWRVGQFDTRAASALIDVLKEAPKSQIPIRDTEPEDGIYLDTADVEGSRIYKVYKMVHGSGKQGVKYLTVPESGTFDYLGLASRHLPTTARKMSLEEAKAFGRLYGVCVRCGATLTDEQSIEAGIGPVCAGRF
jgi:hypothetical protein